VWADGQTDGDGKVNWGMFGASHSTYAKRKYLNPEKRNICALKY
jgi:hypothetical protein